MNSYRLRLDEPAFRKLVAGRIVIAKVHHIDVEVTLDNVPWNRIVGAIADAVAERVGDLAMRPLDPPQAREFLPQRPRK